jgi:hypothetical protein
MPNLAAWLTAFREGPDDFIVPERNPFDYTGRIAKSAGVPSKPNALRAGYASYHLELFDNAALTAKNDGHTVATGKVEEADLDHDLSEKRSCGIDDGSKTGLDVVLWMEANNVWPPLGTRVHSLNPVGRRRMEEVIERAYRRLVRASIKRANLHHASE